MQNNLNPIATPEVQRAEAAATEPIPVTNQVAEVRTVKLPPFWQVEAQFYFLRIESDDTKNFTVVASLESSILQQVSDVVAAPPAIDKNGRLKTALKDRFMVSQDKQIRKLLTELELGDKRPTQLLREMKNLAAGKLNDDILRTLWLQRKPEQVQVVLSVSSEKDISKLADMADKIQEIAVYPSVMAAESAGPCHVKILTDDPVSELYQKLAALTLEVKKLRETKNNRSRSSSHSRLRFRSNSETRGECWYHSRFGQKAKRCKEPCKFFSSSTERPAEN